MSHQRTRTRTTPFVFQTVSRATRNPDETLSGIYSGWNSYTNSYIYAPDPDHRADWQRDTVTKGVWRYNDCTHTKHVASYKTASPYGPYDTPTYTFIDYGPPPTAEQRADGTDMTPFYVKYEVPCSHLINLAKERRKNMYAVRYPKERVEKWFTDGHLPTKVCIDNDPFNSGFSIWFLVADIVQLPKLVAQILSRPILRRGVHNGANSIKQLSNDSLMVKFGILALFRDLVEFFGILNKMLWGFKRFDEMYDKIYRWHSPLEDYTDMVPITGGDLIQEIPLTAIECGDRNLYSHTKILSCQFSRTMAYKFESKDLKDWLSRFKQLIDLFGVLDPSALWDVVPFTFIADWFLGIGNWLHDNRPRQFKSTVKVIDYCEAIKVTYRTDWYASDPYQHLRADLRSFPPVLFPKEVYEADDYRILNEADEFQHIGTETHSTYLRRKYVPEVTIGAQSSKHPLLGLQQCSIAVALVGQRIPRPGAIGDEFDGVDFGNNYLLARTPEADAAAAASKRWAETQRERRAARYGNNTPLWKFEQGSATAAKPKKNSENYKLRYREKAVKFRLDYPRKKGKY